jgi:hypothetical protein
VKHDGYRLLARKENEWVTLWTLGVGRAVRGGRDDGRRPGGDLVELPVEQREASRTALPAYLPDCRKITLPPWACGMSER